MITSPLNERLENYLEYCRTKTFDPMPTELKIHQKDAKEAALWDMEYVADDGTVYPLKVLGQTNEVNFAGV